MLPPCKTSRIEIVSVKEILNLVTYQCLYLRHDTTWQMKGSRFSYPIYRDTLLLCSVHIISDPMSHHSTSFSYKTTEVFKFTVTCFLTVQCLAGAFSTLILNYNMAEFVNWEEISVSNFIIPTVPAPTGKLDTFYTA